MIPWWLLHVACRDAPDGRVPIEPGPEPEVPTELQGGNVLFVLVDDVGVPSLRVYGEHPNQPPTPTIDRLAAEGVTFDRVWAFPTCSPSRAAALTGRWPARSGFSRLLETEVDPWSLPLREVTVPEMLASSAYGYDSALFGKWHLAGRSTPDALSHPLDQGFRWFEGTLENLGHVLVEDGGSHHYGRWEKSTNGVRSLDERYATTATVDDVLARVPEMGEPWFVMVGLHAAHQPFHLPPDTLSTLAPGVEQPCDFSPWPCFDAVVESMDTELGRLLDGLDPEVLARTTVVFAADNGALNSTIRAPYPPLRAKGSVWDGGVRVPLIVTGPLVGDPGTHSDALVSFVDLYPTIAALAGVAPDLASAVDGRSFASSILDPTAPGRDLLFTRAGTTNGAPPPWDVGESAVRDDSFKLIRDADGDHLFRYELGALDEGEELPVDDPEAAEARVRLASALDGWLAEATFSWQDPGRPVAPGPVVRSGERVERAGTEVCNRRDDDGDGLVDEDDPDLELAGARWFWPDADADGFGAGTPVRGCRASDGWAPQAGDCEDGDPAHHPLAPELCGGEDEDCDGRIDEDDPELPTYANGAWWWDLDHDGAGGEDVAGCEPPPPDAVAVGGDCDDADATVGPFDSDGDGFAQCDECAPGEADSWPGGPEACDGSDGDCDAHPDLGGPEGSCDRCPPLPVDVAALSTVEVDACDLDPAARAGCGTGAAVHRIRLPVDPELRRPEVLLWLGGGSQASELHDLAAFAGWPVVSLAYDDLDDTPTVCGSDPACYGRVRSEVVGGVDLAPEVDVSPADAVEVRFTALLEELARRDPGAWAELTAGGEVDWSRVLVAGWDDGAGDAAFLARERATFGALLASGPPDLVDGRAAPWVRVGATPSCAIRALRHVQDPRDYGPIHAALGLTAPVEVPLDRVPYPWPFGAQLGALVGVTPEPPAGCGPIQATVWDGCAPLGYRAPVYRDLVCLLGERDPTCR